MIGRSGGTANSFGITALSGNAYSKTFGGGEDYDDSRVVMIIEGKMLVTSRR